MRIHSARHVRRDRNVRLRHKNSGLAFQDRYAHRVARQKWRAERDKLINSEEVLIGFMLDRLSGEPAVVEVMYLR